MSCKINDLGFCTGCPERCYKGEECPWWPNCKYVHYREDGREWGAPHDNCCFQILSEHEMEKTKEEEVEELTICTLNIKRQPDRDKQKERQLSRSKLREFLQYLSQKYTDIIVCLQEFTNNRDLMELLDDLKEIKSRFAFCGRSSHSHCAVLSTLFLQEVGILCGVYLFICFSTGGPGHWSGTGVRICDSEGTRDLCHLRSLEQPR